jgi:O-antigen/teichoic acid export membrane protein
MLSKLFPKSEFAKNIFALSLGSIGAQVLNFFFTAFLTRIYSPSDFGLLSIYISVSSLIGVFSAGKYDVAIVVSKDRKQSISLVQLCFFITSVFSILSFLVIVFFKSIIITHLDHPEIYNWFYFIPLTLFFTSATQTIWMWNVREKSFKDLSVIRFIETIFNGGTSILLNFMGAIGLLFGTLLSQLSSAVYLVFKLFRRDKVNPFSFEKETLTQYAILYSEFPRFNILQGFTDMLLITGIVLVGSNFFTVYVIGIYSLCMRVLQLPMGLIVKPIAHVFFAEASEKHRRGENFYELTKQTVKRTAFFASIIPVALIIAGPFLFGLVFGQSWRESGVYAQILSFWIFLDLVKAPIAQIPAIVGKQKEVLVRTILVTTTLLLVIAGAGYFENDHPRQAFLIISVFQCVQTLFFILYFLRLSKQTVAK